MNVVQDTAERRDAAPSRPAGGMQAAAQEFVTFGLGEEAYAIDILHVQEIRSYESPTQIPNAPAFIKGVINLRGVIVPIVDLRLKFALHSAEYGDSTVVIVLNIAKRTVGIVVDEVSDVLGIDEAQRRPAPEFGSAVETSFITGIASVADGAANRMLILLDIERLVMGADMGLAG